MLAATVRYWLALLFAVVAAAGCLLCRLLLVVALLAAAACLCCLLLPAPALRCAADDSPARHLTSSVFWLLTHILPQVHLLPYNARGVAVRIQSSLPPVSFHDMVGSRLLCGL